jgi:hypothetical protein
MEIASQDMKLQIILDELGNRTKIFKETYKNVRKLAQENEFFESVVEDYDRYYNYIKNEKQKQYNALKIISEYLEGLIMDTDIVKEQGLMLKMDQANILSKLANVRQELLDITQE